jgi:shikimate 5-dehydrogenase
LDHQAVPRLNTWEATNTDVAGFLVPLEEAFGRPLAGAHAAVIGGGGSARAVIVALLSRNVRVTVHTRRREQAVAVTEALQVDPASASAPGATADGLHKVEIGAWPIREGWDLLVNCTPLGGPTMRDESPLPGGPFGGRLVYDLTYGAGESRLIREAREAGCHTLDGLPMLIAQAERQFEWWTGQRPQTGVMRNAIVRENATESRRHEVPS